MNTSSTLTRWVTLVSALAVSVPVLAEGWPNWRGPNHDGISREKDFQTSWTESPKVLWDNSVGSAFSAFACVGKNVYTCGTKDKQQVVFCFDAESGKPAWETPFEKEMRDGQGGDGTRATPTVDDGRLYLVGGLGMMVCLDATTGKELWHRQLKQKPRWGYAGSVLIEGDLAIVPAGGEDGAILALDKKSGEPVWKCGSGTPGYSTPYPFTYKSTRYIFCFAAKAGIIANAKTGQEAGRIPWETDYDVNASEPIYHDGHLFLSSGYNTGSALYKLAGDGDKLTSEEVWRQPKLFLTKFTSCVLKDGIIYGGDQNGLRCVDFKTGKELWSDNSLRNASVLLANESLIIMTEKGRIIVAKATGKAFERTAEAEVLSGRCWTVPTLADGRLYLRNLQKAVCLDLKTKG